MEFYRKIPLSFFSPHLYNAEAREEKGNGWKFIFALTVFNVLVLVFMLGTGSAGLQAAVRGLPGFVRSLPTMTMKDAQLSIDKPMPYEIKLGDTGLQIVIDTTYKTTDVAALGAKLQNEKIVMLLTKDAFISRGGNGELRIQNFKNTQDFTAGPAEWENIATWLEGWGTLLIITGLFVAMVFGGFIYNTIATLLSAIVVIIFGAVLRVALDFDAAMRLAALARFPASVISLLPFIRPGVSWLVWAAYLVFAVMACRMPSSPRAAE